MAITRLMTAEDLWEMDDDGNRYDLIEGELQRMPPASGDHGYITFEFGLDIGIFVREHGLGRCYSSETGFILSRDPDTVLGPDFAFVRAARVLPDSLHERFLPQYPDFVIETLSRSSSQREAREKMEAYIAAGVSMAVLLDRRRKLLTIFAPGSEPRTLTSNDTFDGGDVLPGFRLPVARLVS